MVKTDVENISKEYLGPSLNPKPMDLTTTKPNKLSPGRYQSVSTLTR